MKQDTDGNGFFVDGRYYLSEPPQKFRLKIISVQEEVNENLDFNLFLLPDFLHIDDVMDVNLHSIYKEAYFCIASGQYDAGIIKLGQLLEITLKQIIFIKTNGLSLRQTFGQALRNAWFNCIIEYEDYKFLLFFLINYRNPYTHRNFREIIMKPLVPVFYFPTQYPGKSFNETDLVKITSNVLEGIKSGKYHPTWINSTHDSTIACQTKIQQDQRIAIYLIWLVTIYFEQIVGIYLNQKCYDKHIARYGSPFGNLTSIEIFEEEE
jgi:hypothetical protein